MTGLQPAAPSFEPLPLHSLDDRSRSPGPLAGASEMESLIRSTDWSQSPIGAVETWSPALRMMVSILLANRFPLLLWWGPHYIQIYNDAYRPDSRGPSIRARWVSPRTQVLERRSGTSSVR